MQLNLKRCEKYLDKLLYYGYSYNDLKINIVVMYKIK